MNKQTFEVKIGDKSVKLDVRRPSPSIKSKGDMVYAKRLKEAAEQGVPVQARMDKLLREQGLWDDDKKAKFEECQARLLEGEKKLLQGGNAGLTKKAARKLAIEMRQDRVAIRLLTSDRNALFANTAEAFAEQARFNYFVAACTVYEETGKPYFKDVDDYLNRPDDDPVSSEAGKVASELFYGLKEHEDFLKTLPENAFLAKYGFANDKGDLVDSQGHLVDVEGRLIDENGRWVDEQGRFVNEKGELVTEEGLPQVEFKEFLEDEPV